MNDELQQNKINLPKGWVKKIASITSLSESLVQKTMSGDPKRQNAAVIKVAIRLAKQEAKKRKLQEQQLAEALRSLSK